LAFTAIVPEPPKPPTLVSPVGTITTTSPTYTWSEVSNATDYYLWVNDSTGNRIQQWYTNDICGYGSGLCSLTPATTLNPGTGQWWVQAKNSAGSSAWSTPLSFTVQGSTPGLPGAATLLSPTGSIATKTPTYTWKPVSNSTWYYLWVNDSQGNRIQQWYTATAVGAGSGTCSVTPAITLNSGAGRWWIQTWTSSGAGPWSAPMNFTVP
jgi:hypothetical protein